MMVGYARVSTDEQSTDLQIDALKRAGCDCILVDRGVSGAQESRPSLDKALALLQSGDTLATWKLDRLGRSLSHLIRIISSLERSGVAFRSLSEAIDTSTASGRLLFHVMGALAEFERSLASERTRAGLAAARARGALIGRPSKLTSWQIERALALLARKCPVREVARCLDVSPLTIRRAVANRRRGNS
jgi:DNA invertase Pin-like site-specific DNA recombinase